MSKRTTISYLFRADPEFLAELKAWASQECRSVQAQIEFALREALERRAGSGSTSDFDGGRRGSEGRPERSH